MPPVEISLLILDDKLANACGRLEAGFRAYAPRQRIAFPQIDKQDESWFRVPATPGMNTLNVRLRANKASMTNVDSVIAAINNREFDELFNAVIIDDHWGPGEADYAGHLKILAALLERPCFRDSQTKFLLFSHHLDAEDDEQEPRALDIAAMMGELPHGIAERIDPCGKSEPGQFARWLRKLALAGKWLGATAHPPSASHSGGQEKVRVLVKQGCIFIGNDGENESYSGERHKLVIIYLAFVCYGKVPSKRRDLLDAADSLFSGSDTTHWTHNLWKNKQISDALRLVASERREEQWFSDALAKFKHAILLDKALTEARKQKLVADKRKQTPRILADYLDVHFE